ncbi:Cytoplasmic FMR1-interacting protein 2, partial [Kappamyces sp. JEL0680]
TVREGLCDTAAESKTASAVVERSDPISLSQLFFARSTLDLMFSEKSKGMKGGLMKEKNFKDSQVAELQKFYDDSFTYPQMMSLSTTIRDCSNLSNLWFKEFYLELTKQVQFRTSTSLPWILAEYVLESQETDILQDLFVPLDLYNDAAASTLHYLKSQYIYNEIEAEINLCFDRFMFQLGKKLFTHYKKMASIQLLDADCKTGKSFWSHGALHPDAFTSVLKQRSIRILGRSVDVNKILSQIVNQYLRLSLDTAICRFESSDITYILELESLIKSSERTHKMLSEFLELERFADILNEVDECIVPCENNGRIVTHAAQELVRDVVPNYGFNNVTSRFLRSSVFYAEPAQRPNFPNARLMYLYGAKNLSIEFSLKYGFYKDYVGELHFASLLRVVGMAGLSVITAQLSNHVS